MKSWKISFSRDNNNTVHGFVDALGIYACHDCAQKDKNIPKDFHILFECILKNSKKVL